MDTPIATLHQPIESSSSPNTEAENTDNQLSLPHNIDAEQALLGILLLNNEAYDRIADFLRIEHFYDPVHGRLYEAIGKLIVNGNLASPVTLRNYLEHDEGLKQLGGASYLGRLTTSATTISHAKQYGQTIYDLALRRMLIEIGQDLSFNAQHAEIDLPPKQQIEDTEKALYDLAENDSASAAGFMGFDNSLKGAIDTITNAKERAGQLSGLETGFHGLDHLLGGLQKSDLLILAGRPAMGKTSLATNIAFHIAQRHMNAKRVGNVTHKDDGSVIVNEGGVVGFFSLEMSAEQLASRILSEQARVESSFMRNGKLHDEDYHRLADAARDLSEMPLYIDQTGAIPVSTLAARARRLQRQHGLDVIIIDYLQLISGTNSNRGSENRVQEISYITQSLKALAKELNVPIVALSQLSRQVETRDNKRPMLADLRESGSIEQDADVVMFVYRGEYYLEKEKPDEGTDEFMKWQEKMSAIFGRAELIIGKNRHGPVSTVDLSFEKKFTRFNNLAEDTHIPERYE